MITKTKSNAAWNGLSAEQRATLERWLFEENLGYEAALERAKRELGFEGSIGSVKRFYHRMAEERRLADAGVDSAGLGERESRRTGMEIVGRMFVKQVTENPEAIKDWAVLARLLLQSEANVLESEKAKIWSGGLALAREKFEFDAAEAVLKKLDNREQLDAEEMEREKARILAIRK
jgi:hypothetical protein